MPLGVLLFLSVPKIRESIHLSRQAQVLLSLVFFAIMAIAFVAQTVTEGRLSFYETVALAGALGILVIRVGKYLRTGHRS